VTDALAALDATAQADIVRRGDASPLELVDAAIERIELLDDAINAVVLRRFDEARAEAKALDAEPAAEPARAPWRGVPFLTKDLGCPTADEPHTDGMRALKEAGWVARETSHLARRFRAAGLVNLGRTNSPELGLVPTTEPVAWGATRNPWDPTRSPGGSSGGSAAAVAAGLVPVAHASDGGGSIRIPASVCGLVGLKTSRGRVSVGPGRGELTSFLSVQFAVTRSVRDAAALLDMCAGAEPGDPVIAPPPAVQYQAVVAQDPPRMRIGLMTTAPGDAHPVHAECIRAAEHAARLLESLGHGMEVSHPVALDDPARMDVFGRIWSVNAASQVEAWGRALGRPLAEDDVEPVTWLMASAGREVPATAFVDAVNAMQAWGREMARWWAASDRGAGTLRRSEPTNGDGFDLLLTPTLGEPPVPLGTFHDADDTTAGIRRAGSFTPFTPAANMTGQPAISLPLHMTPDGLPVGVHLVAAYGREDLLLGVAAQLERVAPWADRRPELHA
jgi:amidase